MFIPINNTILLKKQNKKQTIILMEEETSPFYEVVAVDKEINNIYQINVGDLVLIKENECISFNDNDEKYVCINYKDILLVKR